MQAIWGSSASDVYFADGTPNPRHWNGTAFSQFANPTGVVVNALWGSSATNFWMVGNGGQILQYSSGSFISALTTNAGLLVSVWGTAANDIWAAGGSSQAGYSAILHYDGSKWTTITSTISGFLFSVAVVPGDVWAVGTGGEVWHYNAGTFVSLAAVNTSNLNGSWGIGPGDMWAVGDAGTIVHREQEI